MATALQQFRSRHPEFSELSDFEIADGLRQRLARESDEPVLIRPFFEAIGGPELQTELPPAGEAPQPPPPPPTIARETQPRAAEAPRALPSRPSALEGELGRLDRPDGQQSTEISITVTDPELNQGAPTNIPSLVRGQVDVDALLRGERVSPKQQRIAIERAKARQAEGAELPSFESIPLAEQAARARSEAKQPAPARPPSTEGLTGLELPGEPGTPEAQLTGANLEPAIRGGQALEALTRFATGAQPDERVARRAFRKKEDVAKRTREILGDNEKLTAKQAADARQAFPQNIIGEGTFLGDATAQVMNAIPVAFALFAAQHTDDPEILKDVMEAFGPLDQTPGEASERRTRGVASGAVAVSGGIVGFLGNKTNIEALKSGALTAQGIAEGLMPPNPEFIEKTMAGFGSSAVFWAPGIGIAKGVAALAKMSHVAAMWAGASASGVLEAMAEAGNTFQSLVDQGIKPEEAERRADEVFIQNAAVVTLFNRFGLFGEQALQFARVTLTGVGESAQEFFQQVIGNVAEGDPLLQGTGEAAGIGLIVGTTTAIATPGGFLPSDDQPPGTPPPEPQGFPRETPQETRDRDTLETAQDAAAKEDAKREAAVPPPPTEEEAAAIAADQVTKPTGTKRTVFTPRGDKVAVEFGVVDVNELVTSHDDQGNINPDFPARLQPRDRSKKASAVQIAKIAGNLNPELLGDSPNVTDGAPIVRRMPKEDADGKPVLDANGKPIMQNVVISGNARTIAARQALADERGEAFREALPGMATAVGVGTRDVNAQADPFLVRFLGDEVGLEEFARQANQPVGLELSPAEAARSDAARLTDDDLALFNPDQSGDPLAASNEPFLRRFLAAIGAEESAQFIDDQGRPTKQLADRINSAIFARVYGDDRLIALQAESANPQIKNILAALQAAAPAFAKAKSIDENLAGLNIPQKLTDAIEMIREQQRKGGTIEQLLEQSDLFGERDPEAVGFARFIAANIRSAERMGRAFSTIAEFLQVEVARQQTEDIFGDEAASLSDLIAAANREVEKANAQEDKAAGGTIPDFFGANPPRLPPAGAPEPAPAPGAPPGQPPGEPGGAAPGAAPATPAGPQTKARGKGTAGGEQIISLNALELRVLDKAFTELELHEAILDNLTLEVEDEGTPQELAVAGELVAPTDEALREELREGFNDIAAAIRAGDLAPDFAATDLAAAKAMEDLAEDITEGAVEAPVEEQPLLTDQELDEMIASLAGVTEGNVAEIKREIARNAKATELAAIITEGSPGLSVKRRETEGSVTVFAQGKDVVITFGPGEKSSLRLTPGKVGTRLAAIFGKTIKDTDRPRLEAPPIGALAPGEQKRRKREAAELEATINQAFPAGSEGATQLTKAVGETTNDLSIANLAQALAPEVTFDAPKAELGKAVRLVFGPEALLTDVPPGRKPVTPQVPAEDHLVTEQRRLTEAEAAVANLLAEAKREKKKPDKKQLQIAKSRVRDQQAIVHGITEARARAQARATADKPVAIDFEAAPPSADALDGVLGAAATKAELPEVVFRGEGRSDLDSIYGPGALRDKEGRVIPALGFGRYFAFSKEEALRFGDSVSRLRISALKNPYIVASDEQWRALVVKALGWEFPDPAGSRGEDHLINTARLRDFMEAKGHGAIIVTFPDVAADFMDGPPGKPQRSIKTLRRLFGESQVFIPGPAPQEAEAAEKAAAAPEPAKPEPAAGEQETLEGQIAVLQGELQAAAIDISQLTKDPELSKLEATRLRHRAEEDMADIRREIGKLESRAEKLPVGLPPAEPGGTREGNVIVGELRNAQERILKALTDTDTPQAEREENAAAITVELRALQVELAARHLEVEAKLPSTAKARALDKARSQKVAASLRKTADNMQKQIDAKMDPGTASQNLTPRRARIIDSMHADGRRLESIQASLRAMADAVEDGSLPIILANVKSKAIVEDLRSVNVPTGKFDQKAHKRAENAGLRNQVKWEEARAALISLKAAGPTTDPAITARREFDKLKRDLVGVKGVGVDFFPTPPELAGELVEQADAQPAQEGQPGDSVLEPSAGSGNIIEQMAEIYAGFDDITITALERSPQLVKVLDAQARALAHKHDINVIQRDFLEYRTKHDIIVMNPPFSNNQDIAHVLHAWELLNPGGRLVAVMSEHAFFADGKTETEFRAFLEEHNGTSAELEAGQLADRKVTQRSNVKGRIVEMNKPGGEDIETDGPGIVSEGGTTYVVREDDGGELTDKEKLENAGQLDLFAPEGKPKPPTKIPTPPTATAVVPGLGKPRVKQVRTGTFHSAISRVVTIADAVHVVAPHRKDAQESFIALVTNENGQILRIIRHSIGRVNAAQVDKALVAGSVADIAAGTTADTDPGIVAGAVLETPGAAKVWFAHNHPSGGLTQSRADKQTTAALAELLRGSGIQVMAGIVVAPDVRSASVLPVELDLLREEIRVPIPPGRRNVPIPVVERRIRRVRGAEQELGPINSSDKGRVIVKKIQAQYPDGVILLDNQNVPLVFIQMSLEEMARLRTDDIRTGASKLSRAIVQHNAATAIIHSGPSGTPTILSEQIASILNVGTFLKSSQVQVLDAFISNADDAGIGSFSEKGWALVKPAHAGGIPPTFDMTDVPPGLESEVDLEERSLELVRRTIIEAGGTVQITEDMDGDLSLDLVELPRKARGAGVGTRFMGQLIVHADRYGRTVTLTPQKPGDFTPRGPNLTPSGAQKRLETFYRQFGFQFDATRSIMFRISQTTPATVGATLPVGTRAAQPGAKHKGLIIEARLVEPQPGAPTKPPSGFGVLKTPIAPDKPLRRERILAQVQRDLGIKIYQGRVKGKKSRLGFYRQHIEELRVRHNNDLETVAHELGHFLDDIDSRFSFAYRSPQFRDEVRGLSYDVKSLEEGFAEFLRLFLTQEEEAIARAPGFYEEFVNLISGSKFETAIVRAQADMHAWFRQGALNRALSKIGTDTTFSGRVQDLWFALQETADKFDDHAIENTLDELQGVKILERTIKGDIGDADLSPYKVMRLIRGVRGVVRAVFKHGTIGLQINGDIVFTGKGLRQVFEPVADVMDETMAYFAGMRGMELKRQGRENLLGVRELQALVGQGRENPRIVQAFKDYQEFLDRMMDFYEEAGIVSQQSRAIIQEMNKSYVPFHRIQEIATGEKRFINRAAFKRLLGGTANINDIYNNIMQSTAALIDLSVQNLAKQKVYGLIRRGQGAARFATRIPRDTKVIKIDSAQVAAKIEGILDDMGVVLSDGTPVAGMQGQGGTMFQNEVERHFGDFMKFFTFGNAPIGENVDSVMFNGRREYFEIADPMLLRAMLSFGWRPTNLVIRIMQGFKRTLTFGVTALPDFFIPNLLRDSASGWLLRRSNMIPFVSSIAGLVDRLKRSDDYWLFLANGGGFASSVRTETATTRRELATLYLRSGITLDKVLNTPNKLIDFWLEVGSAFEYGTRLAEFKASVKEGKSLQEAAFRGREVSTDFAMRGAGDFIRNFIATVPFLNARMQGLYRLEREFYETKGQQTPSRKLPGLPGGEFAGQLLVRGMVGLTLPSLALWWINQDDDRYNALPDWIRDLHWVIFVPGEDQPHLIPKPFELGMIGASIPERMMEFVKDRDGKQFTDAVGVILAEQLNMAPVPQIFSPMLDHARNRNFTGGRVIPDDLMKVEASEQFRPWSSETAIFMGEKLGMSPLLYDHYVRGYLGTLGMYLTMATDGLISAQLPDGPAKEWADRPIIRRFTRSLPLRRTVYEDEFYELRQETRRITNTFNKIRAEGRNPGVYINQEGRAALFGLRVTMDSMSRQATRINRALRQNRLDPTKSVADKTRDKKELLRERNNLFKSAADSLSPSTVRKMRERLEREQ